MAEIRSNVLAPIDDMQYLSNRAICDYAAYCRIVGTLRVYVPSEFEGDDDAAWDFIGRENFWDELANVRRCVAEWDHTYIGDSEVIVTRACLTHTKVPEAFEVCGVTLEKVFPLVKALESELGAKEMVFIDNNGNRKLVYARNIRTYERAYSRAVAVLARIRRGL